MNGDKWRDQMNARGDMATHITHLTKDKGGLSSVETLAKIVRERTLVGGLGRVLGSKPVVCFRETPVSRKMLELEGVRYSANGIGFEKPYAFRKGARPVIYDPDPKKNFGADGPHLWRCVTFNLAGKNSFTGEDVYTDWTHEWEWRCLGNMTFELSAARVVLADSEAVEEFLSLVPKADVEALGSRRCAGVGYKVV